ncbi:MAG: hypothetical protein Q8K99_14415 [Actinomycetota bacterium]|nr:hypothetical protein [Actinomycetota bacterium]
MDKANCWEHKECGRQPGGLREKELGVCPAAVTEKRDGKNGGHAAGRFCWKIAGTFCDGEVQGTFSQKMMSCAGCDFFKMVKSEEGADFEA